MSIVLVEDVRSAEGYNTSGNGCGLTNMRMILSDLWFYELGLPYLACIFSAVDPFTERHVPCAQ